MSPSAAALASSVPPGLNATAVTALPADSGAPSLWPVATCQSRTSPPVSALASSVPSGLNATPVTALPARRGEPSGLPVPIVP